LRVGIIGCGKISLSHISALKDIPGIDICGVCDRDIQRAKEIAQAAPGARIYTDLAEFLQRERPESVHILTPPSTHAPLAIQAMEAGCHVIVEKPMALNTKEADAMIASAKANGVWLSTCHNYLFKPSIMKARELVRSGAIGRTIYVNSFYGLTGEGNSYAGAAGQGHWAWRLPGGAFTNFLPHLIYLQHEFLGENARVSGVTLGKATGDIETEIVTSLSSGSTTGTMTVSMSAKPYAKFIEIYGTKGIIRADMVSEVCIINRDHKLPRLISKATFNLEKSLQLTTGTASSMFQVFTGKMKNMPDMRNFLQEFYTSVAAGHQPAVSGEDGRAMVAMLEDIWKGSEEHRQKFFSAPAQEAPPEDARTSAERAFKEHGTPGKILVTGAGGFLGRHLVAALKRTGADVVALVRDSTRIPLTLERQAKIAVGDVSDPVAMEKAMAGVSTVFHCAAVTRNNIPWKVHESTNIRGTEVVMQTAKKLGVQRVIHVSSVIVYGLDKPTGNGTCVGETYPFAAKPETWAYYMRSKIEAEKIALKYAHEQQVPVTIIRPGILYGPDGSRSIGGGLGQIGPMRLLIGSGKNVLPLTYVDNLIDAMLLAAIKPEAIGQAYNIVDNPQVSVREAVARSMMVTGDKVTLVSIPPQMLSGVASAFELRSNLTHASAPPKLSNYVVRSATRDIRYDTAKAQQHLGWHPEVLLDEGLQRALSDNL
jgi:2-alkyl-3-oxoalkanoate reductase